MQTRSQRRLLSSQTRFLVFSSLLASPVLMPLLSPVPVQAQSATTTPTIVIDGRPVPVSPAPIITKTGSVLVPLRGVLEKLGATVNYLPNEGRIEVRQKGKFYSLRVGQKSAIAETQLVPLSAAPQSLNRTTYVPLRSLVELFGYRIQWENTTKTVQIDTTFSPTEIYNHRKALQAVGPFGVTIDFTDSTPAEVGRLLDAAKATGVGMIQTRFDWQVVQSKKNAPFDWALYDAVVAEARKRNLIVVGILGNSTQWASPFSRSTVENEWRFSMPISTELNSFQNYVQQTVSRFASTVHAWQVWDNPASYKLRAAAPKDYRNLVRLAMQAAKRADPNAIIHAAEPGGVNLAFLGEMKRDNLDSVIDGVTLYPASQWQPGNPTRSEELVLPYQALTRSLNFSRDRWIGGLSWPSIDTPVGARVFTTSNEDVRNRITSTFTPQEQADYLLRTSALSLALGADKIFWDRLRDHANYEVVEPFNPELGSGLYRRDLTPRPSLAAMQLIARRLSDKPFKGALSVSPDLVALVFDNGREGDLVAWSPRGQARLALNATQNPLIAGSLYVPTRADSQVFDAAGQVVNGAEGAVQISYRPVLITKLGAASTEEVRSSGINFNEAVRRLLSPTNASPGRSTLRATFGTNGSEDGLYWRKYANFRSVAEKIVKVDGTEGLATEPPPSIFRPADAKSYIFFDVDDDAFFFERGVPMTLTVRVAKSAPSKPGALTNSSSGFSIEYDSATGSRSTRYQNIAEGEGWIEYTFELPDASFGNVNGYDFKINTLGSKQEVVFSEVTLQKKDA